MPPKKKQRPILAVNRSERLQYRLAEIRALFQFLDRIRPHAVAAGELSIVFMDEGEHTELHHNFMDDETPTDVITFPGDLGMEFAGEICVSVDFAASSAIERNLPVARELTLYLVHGWLHLAGFGDATKEERRQMRAEETRLLKAIEAAGQQLHVSVSY